MKIDLEELSARESEQVEWKEGVADPEDVVRTLAAFANDLSNLGGGYVVCGAREVRDAHGFQRLEAVGLTASALRQVEGRVLTGCRERVTPPLVPLVVELPAEDEARRILVFVIAATGAAHVWRGAEEGSRTWVRIGRETREARNGLLLELLSQRGQLPPWDRRHPPQATVADVDLLALRDTLVRIGRDEPGRPVEGLLSDEQTVSIFVPPLCARDPLSRVLRPRNFSLLLFGRAPQSACSEAFCLFSRYPGVDRSTPVSARHEIGGTVLQQAARLIELVSAEAWLVMDKEDVQHPHHRRYPERALREAVVNAIVHRSYEEAHPIRVTAFSDRVEIWSPGGPPRQVQAAAMARGEARPVWRNQGLAWFFNQLELAQGEGQGLATILRTMEANGNPPPEITVTPHEVVCVLRAHPRATALLGQGW
jgi:ATP-dependent DNA helicase RecG